MMKCYNKLFWTYVFSWKYLQLNPLTVLFEHHYIQRADVSKKDANTMFVRKLLKMDKT